jgi:hypothetical protein
MCMHQPHACQPVLMSNKRVLGTSHLEIKPSDDADSSMMCCYALQEDQLALFPCRCLRNVHTVAAQRQCSARHDWVLGHSHLRE